ncbi:zinc finger MYM-type protein 1-like [Rosa chinensis]|uniref:zinc finger MYM-type protein 1-like n=1 Tax=Rosa chinensis TaxID=74649 RepID=UPI000D09160C|nr:zinc finger MYM-type protein 1-like [Rosa chinensis]
MHKWESLRNPSKLIERVISTQSSQEVADNRLRLITTIESVRLLACQGCAFRGHDESVNSSNGGNFNAVVDSFGRMNIDIRRVLQNAPGNAKYTSPIIQKQILNILGNKVRTKIREEVGDAKFCILVDEAVDVSNREQMAIILRFVDCDGFIRERFFKVLSAADTCSQTLKDEISKVLTQYDLQLENMRGQGYDGASNMRAKGVHDIWEFFSTLSLIVNFVDSSAKRHSALRVIREEEIADLVAAGAIETDRGANQLCTLQREGATRWGSHLRSISSLIKLFGATQTTLADLVANGPNKLQGEAKCVGNAMKRFDFVFCLLSMHDVMKITDFLCQSLQKKAIDIFNALNFLSITKSKFQDMREDGWNDLIVRVESFCCQYDIIMLDMSAPYKKSTRAYEQNITNEHYYQVNILNAVIDFQLAELDSRFADNSLELLLLSATLDPHMECGYFLADIQKDPRFANTTTVSDLCRRLVESRKSAFFPMIYRLICLVLTLPVSTATTERAFSSMTIIKNKFRNKMEDEFFDDLMVLYIEIEFADSIDNDSVIAEFEVSGPRRV